MCVAPSVPIHLCPKCTIHHAKKGQPPKSTGCLYIVSDTLAIMTSAENIVQMFLYALS